MQIDGACHCGQVSFKAEADANRVMVCHCTDCQILSGAPYRAVVLAPMESLAVRGQTKSYVKVAQNGNLRSQVFCPECGTPLFATAHENATHASVRIGCVAQRSQLLPTSQIWQKSAQPWINELHGIPGSPEQEAFLPVLPAQQLSSGG
ncbi:MAG: GFA family protein [Rubrivivax sp.]|nr:MAG: GFA family protein [Rubrivivax sp.]